MAELIALIEFFFSVIISLMGAVVLKGSYKGLLLFEHEKGLQSTVNVGGVM